jgi:hypothetical protein
MTDHENRAEDQTGAERVRRAAGPPQLFQKVAFGLGAAVLAGASVVTVPSGVADAGSPDGYVVASVTLAPAITGVIRPNLTACCAVPRRLCCRLDHPHPAITGAIGPASPHVALA